MREDDRPRARDDEDGSRRRYEEDRPRRRHEDFRPPRRREESGTTLFVADFGDHLRARDLGYDFERYGPLVRCDIPRPKSSSSKPYAFVEFKRPDDAEIAYRDLRHKFHIEFARNRPRITWDTDRPPPDVYSRGRSRTPPRGGRYHLSRGRSPPRSYSRSRSPRRSPPIDTVGRGRDSRSRSPMSRSNSPKAQRPSSRSPKGERHNTYPQESAGDIIQKD